MESSLSKIHEWDCCCSVAKSYLKLMSIESVMPSNHPICCYTLLLFSIFLSRIFSNESALRIRWPKYWSFSFSISPSNEYSGLIFFRIDWLDLLAVQGTLKVSNTTVWNPLLYSVQPSSLSNSQSIHDYWKNIALTRWTFVGKLMFLLFIMLSSFVIAFLPRSKHVWILRLQWFWNPRK